MTQKSIIPIKSSLKFTSGSSVGSLNTTVVIKYYNSVEDQRTKEKLNFWNSLLFLLAFGDGISVLYVKFYDFSPHIKRKLSAYNLKVHYFILSTLGLSTSIDYDQLLHKQITDLQVPPSLVVYFSSLIKGHQPDLIFIQNVLRIMSNKKPEPTFSALVKRITTIHGTSHFKSLRGRSLRVWSTMMVVNMLFTAAFVLVIREKFNENSIITQINANCKVSQVPYPGVSICNFNLVSLRESANIAKVLRDNNRSEQEIQDFFNALPLLKDYNRHSQNVGHFVDIMKILKYHFFTIDTIMEEVHQKCDNLLVYCAYNRQEMNCANIFSFIKTYEGYCCTFNYAALNDGNEAPLLPTDADLEFYDDQNEAGSPQIGSIISTSESGSSSGLEVIINVEPDDYPTWSTVRHFGAKVLITDPNDYPETSVVYRHISPGDAVSIKVEALVFQSEGDLRRVDPEKRGCWFYDEVSLEHTDRYSYETCNTECRMQTYLNSCGCIPYKYPREKSKRMCELADLGCLNNVTVYKSKKEMACQPICYQECRDKKYSITSDLLPFIADGAFANLTNKYDVNELAKLKVYFGKSNCNCYKLMLLIDVNYFIATYGGVFSLCFGGSILTLFELAYLLVSTALSTILREIKKRHQRETLKWGYNE